MKSIFKDKFFLRFAIKQAANGFRNGNYPVGAVLAINGKVVGQTNNSLESSKNWHSHAELELIQKCSAKIKHSKLDDRSCSVVLYSTLEPCLMCFGAAVLNRVDRVVYGLPDPRGGGTKFKPPKGISFYKEYWPKISGGFYEQEIFAIMRPWIIRQTSAQWKKNLSLFEKSLKSKN